MTNARRAAIVALALLAPILLAAPASAADFFVFPVKLSLPVFRVLFGFEADTVEKRTLKEKDIVNLALGRPLGTKVDKNTEILALAMTFEPPSTSPLSKVIVFDPSQSGVDQVRTVVAQAIALDFDAASAKAGSIGQGTASAEVQETMLGDPGEHALHETTVRLTGTGKSSPLVPPGLDLKISLQGAVTGRLSFTTTTGGQTTTFSGFIVSGKAKASGKPIGTFTE